MQYHKSLINGLLGLTIACIVGGCVMYYAQQLTVAKRRNTQLAMAALQVFKQQQQDLLQKLGQQLTPLVLQRDIKGISQILNVYEDQSFVLAKHRLTVPVSVQFISLNAPQQMITSNGTADNMVLAPDEAYYMRAVATPKKLEWSKVYTQASMPNYDLINLGCGVIAGDSYLGHLDVQLAISSLEAFMQAQLNLDPKLFNLQFAKTGLEAPKVSLRPAAYWSGLLRPALQAISIVLVCTMLLLIIYRLYMHIRDLNGELNMAEDKINDLNSKLSMYKAILTTQQKYGAIAIHGTEQKQMLNMQQLIQDICAVNADVIAQRHINLDFPHKTDADIYLQTNALSLMQILSGILYEILLQLPDNSTVKLQIIVQNLSNTQQKIVFKFSDNGFYTSLQDRFEQASNADVRIKGWDNIKQAIDLIQGTLEHVHTAYEGNVIYFSIVQNITNNVINLAFQ